MIKAGSFSSPNVFVRRAIADKVLITMGPKMTHFEADIDPTTGTVIVDHIFKPNILSPHTNDHMIGQHEMDPTDEDFKIKVCDACSRPEVCMCTCLFYNTLLLIYNTDKTTQ